MSWDKKWQLLLIWLFHALILVVPFVFTWVNEELFEFNKMLAVYAFATCIGLVWIFRIVAQKALSFRSTWFDLVVLIFLFSQLVSTIFSLHPATSLFGYYTRFHGGLLSTFSYTLLYFAFVNNVEVHHLKSFFRTLLISAVGVSLYAIPEHFGLSPSCVLITGEMASGTSCWVQDVQTRVFATFGQPNWLAAYLITILPLSWYLLAEALNSKKRSNVWVGVLVAAPILIGAALLFTKSRSGILGLVAGAVIWCVGALLVMFSEKQAAAATSHDTTIQKNQTLSLFIAAAPFLLMFVPAVLWGTPFTPSLQNLTTTFQTTNIPSPSPTSIAPTPLVNRLEEGGTDSGEIRKIVWEGAFNVWKRYPLFGSGVETFAYSYYLDRPLAHNLVSEWDFLYNKAHNELLNFLATTGIVGLSAYLAFLGGIVILAAPRLQGGTPTKPYLSLAVVSSLVALSVSNFFGFSTVMVGVLLYLLPAFLLVMQDRPQKEVELPILRSGAEYVVIILGCLIALWLGSSISSIWRADSYYTTGKSLVAQGELTLGITSLQKAAETEPNQALFHDELASVYSSVARQLALENQSTTSAQLAEAAILSSNKALQLNPAHLNFYKTRARVLINLGSINPEFLTYAEETLLAASELAPTDPKIIYNLGLVSEAMNQPEKAQSYLEKAVELKPNYVNALAELGLVYQLTNQLEKSQSTYLELLKYNPEDTLIKDRLDAVTASISATQK